MRKLGILVIIVFCGSLICAQEQTTTFKSDTIWLKTGLAIPCKKIEDSTK